MCCATVEAEARAAVAGLPNVEVCSIVGEEVRCRSSLVLLPPSLSYLSSLSLHLLHTSPPNHHFLDQTTWSTPEQ